MAGCWVVYTSPDCPYPALGRPLLYPTTSPYLVRICLGWGLKASPGGSLVSQTRQTITPLSQAGTAPQQPRGRRTNRGPAPPARPRNAYYLVLDLLGLGRDSPLWPYTSVTFPTNRFRARDGWASSWQVKREADRPRARPAREAGSSRSRRALEPLVELPPAQNSVSYATLH